MKPRKSEAARLETDYLARVKRALAGRDASEVEEVVESVTAHIEEELSGDLDGEVSLVQMANVLERLGPPEAYMEQGSNDSAAEAISQSPRLSRKAVLGALMLPIMIAVDLLILAIGKAVDVSESRLEPFFAMVGFTGLIGGVVISLSALSDIRRSGGRLRGRSLALTGVILPVALVVLGAITYYGIRPCREGRPERPAPVIDGRSFGDPPE